MLGYGAQNGVANPGLLLVSVQESQKDRKVFPSSWVAVLYSRLVLNTLNIVPQNDWIAWQLEIPKLNEQFDGKILSQRLI